MSQRDIFNMQSLDLWSQPTHTKSMSKHESRPEADPSSAEVWTPPKYVNLTQLEVRPESTDQEIWTPRISEFSLPRAFMQSCTISPPQGPSSSQSRSSAAEPIPRGAEQTSKDRSENDECTLDEFWYDQGNTWKVQLPKEEAQKPPSGLASCHTGPECHTCGSSLTIAEMMDLIPCRVCGCYN
ncbi:hypothetical protein F5Y13DRAFT_170471 [Hypoxylon sp. FL1857]|nr:hypothetical protein F5Y13DRAFT_170471 [Hypoxylon sp. FL1857]